MNDRATAPRVGGWMVLLVCWALWELLSGGWLHQRFSTEAIDQHVLLMHLLVGLVVAVPALGVLFGRRSPPQSERGGPWPGLFALAVMGAIASGAWLTWFGSTSGPSIQRDAHAVTAVAALLMLGGVAAFGRRAASRRQKAASGAAALLALLAMGLPAGGIAVSMRLWPTVSMEGAFAAGYHRPERPFRPARLETAHGGPVKVESLQNSATCAECHQDIYKQWLSSSHRHSTVSKWYQAQLELRMKTSTVRGNSGARFCGACHEPIVTLSGNMDDGGLGPQYPPNLDQGVSCTSCHRITELRDTHGNGSYVYEAHRPYLFEGSENPLLAALGRGLIRSKPQQHARDLMRPQMRTSAYCASCHQVFMQSPHGAVFQIQDDFHTWSASPYNRGPLDPRTRNCQDCHMPLVASTDPAAKNGKVRSHRFIGANTTRPYQTQDWEQLQLTEEFLKQACYLSVLAPGSAEPGSEASFQVVVTNANVGHDFPGGTADMVEAWIETIVTDGSGRRLLASGLVDEKTWHVDPAATYFRTVPVDIYGKRIFKRDLWRGDRYAEFRKIRPQKSDATRYSFPVPPDASGPIHIRARLRFRRSNQLFTDFAFGPGKMSPPITDIALHEANVELTSVPKSGPGASAAGGGSPGVSATP